jgi:sugar/nucleoside kinase (ribokinase family)
MTVVASTGKIETDTVTDFAPVGTVAGDAFKAAVVRAIACQMPDEDVVRFAREVLRFGRRA